MKKEFLGTTKPERNKTLCRLQLFGGGTLSCVQSSETFSFSKNVHYRHHCIHYECVMICPDKTCGYSSMSCPGSSKKSDGPQEGTQYENVQMSEI